MVENNIMVDGGFDPHVWFAESGDIFRRNIVWTDYRPANMHRPPWGAEMDFNLVQNDGATTNAPATRLQQQSGRDEHSIVADAQFVDPAHGDYRVKDGSPALALGFVNFPMDQFGVQKPELKAIARVPQLPQPKMPAAASAARDAAPATWLGASVRNIADEGEMSAFGLPGVTGVLVLEVPADSRSGQSRAAKKRCHPFRQRREDGGHGGVAAASSGIARRKLLQDRHLPRSKGIGCPVDSMKNYI